jgi:hypothetical protein
LAGREGAGPGSPTHRASHGPPSPQGGGMGAIPPPERGRGIVEPLSLDSGRREGAGPGSPTHRASHGPPSPQGGGMGAVSPAERGRGIADASPQGGGGGRFLC